MTTNELYTALGIRRVQTIIVGHYLLALCVREHLIATQSARNKASDQHARRTLAIAQHSLSAVPITRDISSWLRFHCSCARTCPDSDCFARCVSRPASSNRVAFATPGRCSPGTTGSSCIANPCVISCAAQCRPSRRSWRLNCETKTKKGLRWCREQLRLHHRTASIFAAIVSCS